jgi:murein DD-endopeptidase MepM/ murein hydrolase activator NlpD
LYLVGATFLRLFLRYWRTFLKSLKTLGSFIGRTAVYAVWNIYKGLMFLFEEIVSPSKKLINFTKHFFKMLKNSHKSGGVKLALSNTKNLIVNNRREIKKNVGVLSSYILPVLALFFFLVSVGIFNTRVYAVSVSLNGEHIGYIQNEGVYNDAEKLMQERIVYSKNQDPYFVSRDLTVKTVSASQKFEDAYSLCNTLISAVSKDIKEAYGLYVNGNFEGAVEEGTLLRTALDKILDENKMGIQGEQTVFESDVQIKEGLYPEASVMPFNQMFAKINSEVAGERTYTIVSGDAPILIAKKNNITLSQLRALNPEIDKRCLIGDVVLIAKSKPFLTVQTKVVESYEVEIPYKLVSTKSNKYAYGTTTVVKAGKAGKAIETAEKVYVNGVLQTTNVINTQVITAAVNREVIVGTYINTTASTGSGKYTGSFMWPVDGGYVSCHINGYKGHTGMDIAAPKGTNIRASMSGRVIKAKKQTTNYGYHIMIDHGNGVQTLYAHCSKLLVSVGDYVEQGEVIAKVGSTGRSTGNHCHFEIRINGQYKNPANYVGSYYK